MAIKSALVQMGLSPHLRVFVSFGIGCSGNMRFSEARMLAMDFMEELYPVVLSDS